MLCTWVCHLALNLPGLEKVQHFREENQCHKYGGHWSLEGSFDADSSSTRSQGKTHNCIRIRNGSFLYSKLLDFGVHVLLRDLSGTVLEMNGEEVISYSVLHSLVRRGVSFFLIVKMT